MTYLEALNRVLRQEGIIRGDDDNVTSFSDTQHSGTINLAKIAIEDELTHLVSEDIIPFERVDDTITLTTSRTYALNTNFVRFDDPNPFFLEVDGSGNSLNVGVPLYPGGEEQLRRDFLDYREGTGEPQWFYFIGGTTKQVGFYPVPSTSGKIYRYYYEKDVSVSVETDNIPLVSTQEANIFASIAARRFKYLFASPQIREGLFPQGVERDPLIESNRATLMSLLKGRPPTVRYGRSFR